MENIFRKITFQKAAFILLFFVNTISFGQTPACPFSITNLTGCDLLISWEMVDGANVTLCGNSAISMPSGNNISIGCCGGVFDVYVVVVGVWDGSTYVNPIQSQSVNGNITSCPTCPHISETVSYSNGSCMLSGFNIIWSSSGVVIN